MLAFRAAEWNLDWSLELIERGEFMTAGDVSPPRESPGEVDSGFLIVLKC